MTRTQLLFESETLQRARARAGQLGISLAAYVRRLVDEDLGGSTRTADPTAVFDLGSSGGADVASDKDAMLGDAFSGPGR